MSHSGLGRQQRPCSNLQNSSDLWKLLQVLMVVLVWLWIVPLLTCWMWRLGFTTSFSHGLRTVTQRMSPLLLLADCIQVCSHHNPLKLSS